MSEISDELLEKLQKKAKRRFVYTWVITGAVFIAALLFCLRFYLPEPSMPVYERIYIIVAAPVVAAIGAAALFYVLLVQSEYKSFDLNFKNKYVLPTVRSAEIFEDLDYQPLKGIGYNDIRNGAVVACGQQQHFHSEDLLSGKYQDIRFYYCDVHTQKMVRRSKKQELRTLFKGQVMWFSSFDESKTSAGHLQIFEKEFLSTIEGWTAEHRIQTEDERFNKRFQIYAADPHNAFYILTPRMLEQITEFADAAGEQIAITFKGPVMYVAISRARSMFNGSVKKPIAQQRQDILDDVALLKKAGNLLILELNTMH